LSSRQNIINATKQRVGNIGLPILALCWVSFFWGTTWLATKEGVKAMPALQMAGLRLLIGGCLYMVFFLYKKVPWPKGRQWLPILILTFLNFVLSNGMVTLGLKYINSGLAAIIGAVVPLWIVIFSAIRGERLPLQAIAGILLGFGGVCIIFYDHLQDFFIADFRLGIIFSVAGGISWALGSMYMKKKAASFNPYFSLGFQMLISGIVLSGIAQVDGKTISYTAIPANAWWAILYLVIIGSVLTFAAYIYTLQHLPMALASVYAYINPVVAVLLGAIILHEPLNGFIAVGGAVTIAGVYLVNYAMRRAKQAAVPPPQSEV
jgi:drug/metabolite transporter (DMT)-like permease